LKDSEKVLFKRAKGSSLGYPTSVSAQEREEEEVVIAVGVTVSQKKIDKQ
jgi:hypothetical protein